MTADLLGRKVDYKRVLQLVQYKLAGELLVLQLEERSVKFLSENKFIRIKNSFAQLINVPE